ncbi:MAG: hypothetical protein GXW85_06715 [Clostridia bacterium]|nr:hypothetical protein [Clostridia bacterium]
MKLNKFLFYILLVLLILNSWACMGKPEAKPQIKPKTKIGLILAENKSARNEFIYKKMQEEIEKQKMKLITGTSELNVEKQEVNIKK